MTGKHPDDSPPVERQGGLRKNVEAARLANGWTKEDLAHAAGVTAVQISRIEQGKREMRLTTIVGLLRALDVRADDLFEGLYP